MNLYGYPTLIFDYSAYETFKYRGIDIISSKKIKNSIITIYESELDYLSKDFKNEFHQFTFQTISAFKDNIAIDKRKKQLIINDYTKLQSDLKFINTLLFTLTFYDMGLGISTKTKENILKLTKSIDKELIQLQ